MIVLYSRDHKGVGVTHEKTSRKNQPQYSVTMMRQYWLADNSWQSTVFQTDSSYNQPILVMFGSYCQSCEINRNAVSYGLCTHLSQVITILSLILCNNMLITVILAPYHCNFLCTWHGTIAHISLIITKIKNMDA